MLLQLIDEESVVPVVGRDLLTVSDEGREAPLYPWLARELAERLRVTPADAPDGGELETIARRHLAASPFHRAQDIHRELKILLRELDESPICAPLVQLARLTEFKLFVSTTFDFLIERAIDQERFGGQRQTFVFSYAPNDKQDLPPELERLNRPTVFHLLGRFSATPYSYALTEEDTREFLQSLQSKTEDSPHVVLDKLRASNLLVLGSGLADWLTTFFVRSTRGGRHLEVDLDPAFAAGDSLSRRDGAAAFGGVVFLQHFAGGSKVFRARGAAGFVNELYQRWRARRPVEEPKPPSSMEPFVTSTGRPTGTVYVSCTQADRDAAESIRDALDRAGVDAIIDIDDAPIAERWDSKLRRVIGECALFVPVVSKRATTAERRFFRPEWVEAIVEAKKTVPSGRFVLPVVIDETSPEPAFPEGFGDIECMKLPGGAPSATFVEKVVQLQRRYRSASFA